MFEDWDKQKLDTIAAAIKYPLQYMPMYHYEPRRWSIADTGKHQPEKEYYDPPENWDIPFEEIATPDKPGTFIGFKMYTALGYKPLDSRLNQTLTGFYGKCEQEGIPVLCHCSPSGMCTHDRKLYFDLDKSTKSDYKRKFWFDRKTDWYYDEFVSPAAWEKQVLKKFNNLTLCLAHFGGGSSGWADWKNNTINKTWAQRENGDGPWNDVTKEDEIRFISDWYHKKDHDKPQWIKQFVDLMEKKDGNSYKYPNFYTDISYHFIKDHQKEFLWIIENHPIVKERVMFGTDWYMTELDKKSIGDFVGEAKPIIDGISEKLEAKTGIRDDLWLRFTRVNPMKFYGIRGIADKFGEGLALALVTNKKKLKRKCNVTKLNKSTLDKNLKVIKDSDFY